jgi:hypothetical protein
MLRAAVSAHRQRSSEDLVQLLAWYKIRDCFFEEDVWQALALAEACNHPNAVWLRGLFAGRDVETEEEMILAFRACDDDSRAACFAAILENSPDEIRRAADRGDAFAQAWMASKAGEERFVWAERSASQGERNGFAWLSLCYIRGKGCEQNMEAAKEYSLIAGELGDALALIEFGESLETNDPDRFVWFGKAADMGDNDSLLTEMEEKIDNFNSGTGHASVVFAIGRALKGHIDSEKKTLFGEDFLFRVYIGSANQAVHFYNFQLQCYRQAVDTWTFVGLRNKVVKDIRKMIGKMIWDAREEAKYKLR